jgi:hypothetical protein
MEEQRTSKRTRLALEAPQQVYQVYQNPTPLMNLHISKQNWVQQGQGQMEQAMVIRSQNLQGSNQNWVQEGQMEQAMVIRSPTNGNGNSSMVEWSANGNGFVCEYEL